MRKLKKEKIVVQKKEDFNLGFLPLTKTQAIALEKELELKPETSKDIKSGNYRFTTFKELISLFGIKPTIKNYFDPLDTYAELNADEVIQESPEGKIFLFEKNGLNANGFVIMFKDDHLPDKIIKKNNENRDLIVAYAIFHPVFSVPENKLHKDFSEMYARAHWTDIRRYIEGLVDSDKLTLYHHYDYAVTYPKYLFKEIGEREYYNEMIRQHGLGRLVLYLTASKSMPINGISVGFIDSSIEDDVPVHLDSMIAAMKAGFYVGKEIGVNPNGSYVTERDGLTNGKVVKQSSFDGWHPSFLVLFSKSLTAKFTGEVIKYNRNDYSTARDSLIAFGELIRQALKNNPKKVVAYNKNKEHFELATLHYSPRKSSSK